MRFRGILLAVTVLLAGSACTRDVAGAPAAGDSPSTRESSEAPEPTRIPECTGCDEETAAAAMENPVVAQPKRADNPPACEDILPLSAIAQIVGASTRSRASAHTDQCHAEWQSADLSRLGLVWVRFSGPGRLTSSTITDFEGSTRYEEEDTSNNNCRTGIAINDDLEWHEYGSWLVLRVNVDKGSLAPCEAANQLLDIAFDNLADA